MNEAETVKEMAEILRRAQSLRSPIPALRDVAGLDAGMRPELAYKVQQFNVDHALSNGRRVVGRKIGLTSLAVQKQIGVDQPDFGTLLDDMVYGDNEVVPMTKLLQPKVEGEIALVLSKDLPHLHTTWIDIVSATQYVLPAIEIVDSRIADWKIGFFDTVADNASSGLVVVGGTPRKLEGLDLRDCQMAMKMGNQVVSRGTGANCLGHPLNAAVWLARKMASLQQPLKAGDLILTGALGPMVAAKAGDRFEMQISGIGSVAVQFSEIKTGELYE
ncbi:2-keto-4-pentenoate hydratase [Ottowia thiooxydans]|uniref:2-keto-4-pentenoate hydratase n=1 Tax=Ottowia thiooxydans TaxID=219182 RepID=A0ABV2QG26_9BURK